MYDTINLYKDVGCKGDPCAILKDSAFKKISGK